MFFYFIAIRKRSLSIGDNKKNIDLFQQTKQLCGIREIANKNEQSRTEKSRWKCYKINSRVQSVPLIETFGSSLPDGRVIRLAVLEHELHKVQTKKSLFQFPISFIHSPRREGERLNGFD